MAGHGRSVVRSLLYAMLAVGLAMGLAFPPVVAPFAEYRPGAQLVFAALCIGAGLLVGAVNFFLVRAFLLRPVRSVTDELAALARGDRSATGRVTFTSDDDVGRLVERFNELLERLRGATRDVLDIGESLARDTGRAGEAIRELAAESASRSQVVAGTVRLHDSVAGELRRVGEVLERLGAASRETVAAVARQLELTEDADRRVAELQAQSGRTAEGAGRIARAAQRTSGSVRELAGALETAAASTTQMDAAVREVVGSLESSERVAEQVAGDATDGERSVESTRRSMERIQESVEGAAGAIRSFSESVSGIAAVTQVIDEVTEQTNLLALNAAIIAAQAGRHGVGFAVVAGQIKKLADRTASSTREIGALIAGFREQAAASLASMGQSRTLVDEGVVVSREAAAALGRIRGSAATSLEQTRRLEGAMREITTASRHLAGTIEGVAGRSREISEAVREQEQALAALDGAAEVGRESSAAIARAAQALLGEARRIRGQADGVGANVETSMAAIRAGLEQTELLSTTVETVRDLDARERASLARLEHEAGRLAREAHALLAGIERIRPRGGGDDGHRGPAAGVQDFPVEEGGAGA